MFIYLLKDPEAGKDWGHEEKRVTEDEMVGWHYPVNGHEFEKRRWWRTGKPGMLQSMGSQRVGHDWATEQQQQLTDLAVLGLSCSTLRSSLRDAGSLIAACELLAGEDNGNPLQYSYLENLRDGGAWWAAVYGVAQSRTRLKRLSSSRTLNCGMWDLVSWLRISPSLSLSHCNTREVPGSHSWWQRQWTLKFILWSYLTKR